MSGLAANKKPLARWCPPNSDRGRPFRRGTHNRYLPRAPIRRHPLFALETVRCFNGKLLPVLGRARFARNFPVFLRRGDGIRPALVRH